MFNNLWNSRIDPLKLPQMNESELPPIATLISTVFKSNCQAHLSLHGNNIG